MRTWWVVAAAAWGISAAAEAAACGGGVVSSTTSTGVTTNAQRVFLSFHDDVTDVVVQIGVPSAMRSYAALLPVLGEPAVDPEPIPVSELDSLDASTVPVIVKDTPASGCISPFPGMDRRLRRRGGAGRGGARSKGVRR